MSRISCSSQEILSSYNWEISERQTKEIVGFLQDILGGICSFIEGKNLVFSNSPFRVKIILKTKQETVLKSRCTFICPWPLGLVHANEQSGLLGREGKYFKVNLEQ